MISLRILMFTTFYPPHSFGGDAVGVQRMARALAARGHEVTVVHDEDAYHVLGGSPVPADDTGDGVRRIGLKSRLGMVSELLTQQTGHPLVHRRRIRELLEEGRYDIVWYNNISLVGGPGLMGLGKGLKIFEAHEHWLVCPTHVLWRHGRELCTGRQCLRCILAHRRPPQLWRYTAMIERKLAHVNLLIAKSEFSRRKHAEFGLKRDMEVLPYFLPDLDAAGFPPPAEHDRPFFLFVGRLEKIKGLQDVIPVFERYPDADLLIVGDGDYSAELKRLAGENKRIRFVGRKPLDEVMAYYRGALGLIVPSVCYETFGIILIESFRLGTPVIARRLGPFPEIVETSGGGVLFENEEELLAAMRMLQNDGTSRRKMADAARKGFETFWREDQVLARFGAAFARAAHADNRHTLARALDAGALENGSAIT